MKPKPLKLSGIKRWVKKDLVVKAGDIDRAIDLTLYKTKERIKLACEFYLKYVNRPEVLLKNKHYSWLFNRTLPMFVGKTYGWWHYKYVLSDDVEDRYIAMDLYNQWLFKLAFKDIFEELK